VALYLFAKNASIVNFVAWVKPSQTLVFSGGDVANADINHSQTGPQISESSTLTRKVEESRWSFGVISKDGTRFKKPDLVKRNGIHGLLPVVSGVDSIEARLSQLASYENNANNLFYKLSRHWTRLSLVVKLLGATLDQKGVTSWATFLRWVGWLQPWQKANQIMILTCDVPKSQGLNNGVDANLTGAVEVSVEDPPDCAAILAPEPLVAAAGGNGHHPTP
jgi:hypothetical protein